MVYGLDAGFLQITIATGQTKDVWLLFFYMRGVGIARPPFVRRSWNAVGGSWNTRGVVDSGIDPAVCIVYSLHMIPTPLVGRVDGEASESANLECSQSIQGSFEVVQDDRIGQAFEDKGELPEGIDSDRQDLFERISH